MYATQSEFTVVNNVYYRNEAASGSGVYLEANLGTVIVNSTFYDNAEADGSAIYTGDPATEVHNSILWQNGAVEIQGAATVTYSTVTGGMPGPGNSDLDPEFVDASTGDFRLSAGSPCIDAADNTAVPAGVIVDLDGNSRFVDDPATTDTGVGSAPIVDMGAYEFQVDSDCPADVDGDGVVDINDLFAILAAWGDCDDCPEDVNGDGTVDINDVFEVLACWGPC